MLKDTVQTLCGGKIELKVDKNVITIKLIDVKEGDICKKCQFKNVCIHREREEDKKRVKVAAFTGMVLGDLEVIKEDEKTMEVVTSAGRKLVFDKSTGMQTNCKNAKFANRIVV